MEKASEEFKSEAVAIFHRWLDKTVQVLEQERAKLNVEDSKDLKDSLRNKVISIAADELGGQILFLTRGRFVDMGAGRQRTVSDLGTSRRRKQKARKPKKWYSPAFYGRLNDLQGALGIRLMENSLEAMRDGLT